MNIDAEPTPMSTSETLSRHIILKLTKLPQASHSCREHLLSLKIYPKIMRAPGFEPWWARDTTVPLTIQPHVGSMWRVNVGQCK